MRTFVPVDIDAELQLVARRQLLGHVGRESLAIHHGSVHGTQIGDEDLWLADVCVGGEDSVVARDDRAVDVCVVGRWHEVLFCRILGRTSDGELCVEGEVELARGEALEAVDVPEDDAERYTVSGTRADS